MVLILIGNIHVLKKEKIISKLLVGISKLLLITVVIAQVMNLNTVSVLENVMMEKI